jgi:glutathione S-transferase
MMMLRASTDAAVPNPRTADEASARSATLEEFVAAVVGDDPTRADAARATIVDRLGPDWLIDTSAVVANFEMMTRLADATGARLTPGRIEAAASIRAQLDLDAFPSARR